MKMPKRPTAMNCRRAVATVAPAAMPVAMRSVFMATASTFGRRRGYQAGFAVYWATCWAAAAALTGPRRLARTFRHSKSLPRPRALAIAVLAFPAVGAVLTELRPNVRRAGPAAIATSVGIGLTNALAEEAFWRALPVTLFPDDRVRGWLWPAAGFTVWHLVPLHAAGTDAGRAARLVFGAGLIGLGYGWVAFKAHSVASTVGPHAITDASGVGVAEAMWLGR
jgi:membrane protease YdiL (CAAX protease family)